MPFTDFTMHFLYVFVCRVFDDSTTHLAVQGEWKGDTAAGGPASKNMVANPQYHLQVSSPVHMYITLTQEDKRAEDQPFHHIALWLFAKDGKRAASCKKSTVVKRSSTYADFRTSTLEIENLAPGSLPYTLVPTTFDAGEEAKFHIDVYADNKRVNLTEIPFSHPSA